MRRERERETERVKTCSIISTLQMRSISREEWWTVFVRDLFLALPFNRRIIRNGRLHYIIEKIK